MAERAVAQLLEFLQKALRASGVRADRLIVFGSQARGTAGDESDVDIAIISRDYEGKDIFERIMLAKQAVLATAEKFVVPMDIVHLTPGEYDSGSSPLVSFVREGEEASVPTEILPGRPKTADR